MNQVDKKIEELETSLNELKEQRRIELERGKSVVFTPLPGQDYWVVDHVGEVDDYTCNVDGSDYYDREAIGVGNVYRTKEEASMIVKNRKIHRRLQELANFVPDWATVVAKSFITFDYDINKPVVIQFHSQVLPSQVYFPYSGAALDAIDTIEKEFGNGSMKDYLTRGVI